jgi:hypothetical protein
MGLSFGESRSSILPKWLTADAGLGTPLTEEEAEPVLLKALELGCEPNQALAAIH